MQKRTSRQNRGNETIGLKPTSIRGEKALEIRRRERTEEALLVRKSGQRRRSGFLIFGKRELFGGAS